MAEKHLTVKQKLEIIQKRTGLSQTKLAEKIGVSFVAFNGWWTEKSVPRAKTRLAIEDLFLEVTGQKIISEKELSEKKEMLLQKSASRKNILGEILSNPDIHDRFVLNLTYNSNKMEGSTLTEQDTAAILFDNVALPDKSLTEQLEAKNHQTALVFLFDHLAKKEKINEDLIVKLHSILMSGIHPDAGRYRSHAVRILGVDLPTANYLSVPKLVSELVSVAGKHVKDIIELSSFMHASFEKIHPFSDGNGRIGRLILNAVLLENNFAPAVMEETQKRLYYAYLYEAQTKNDTTRLQNFLCDASLKGFKILDREDL